MGVYINNGKIRSVWWCVLYCIGNEMRE